MNLAETSRFKVETRVHRSKEKHTCKEPSRQNSKIEYSDWLLAQDSYRFAIFWFFSPISLSCPSPSAGCWLTAACAMSCWYLGGAHVPYWSYVHALLGQFSLIGLVPPEEGHICVKLCYFAPYCACLATSPEEGPTPPFEVLTKKLLPQAQDVSCLLGTFPLPFHQTFAWQSPESCLTFFGALSCSYLPITNSNNISR